MAMNQEVDAGVDKLQVLDLHFVQTCRKNRLVEANLTLGRAHGHSQASAQQQEDRAGRPGLRSAGHWIKGRTVGPRPLVKPAEEIRQPQEVADTTPFKQSVQDRASLVLSSLQLISSTTQGTT